MEARSESEMAPAKNRTTTERTSDRELVVTRTIHGPARLVFEAWTTPELFQRWWVPKSFPLTLVACEMDARPRGKYRLEFRHQESTFQIFGKYIEVTPYSRLVWTNDEDQGGGAVTTVTFQEIDGKTLVVVHDLYPSKEALDEAIASGQTSGMPEQLDGLDEFIVTLRAS